MEDRNSVLDGRGGTPLCSSPYAVRHRYSTCELMGRCCHTLLGGKLRYDRAMQTAAASHAHHANKLQSCKADHAVLLQRDRSPPGHRPTTAAAVTFGHRVYPCLGISQRYGATAHVLDVNTARFWIRYSTSKCTLGPGDLPVDLVPAAHHPCRKNQQSSAERNSSLGPRFTERAHNGCISDTLEAAVKPRAQLTVDLYSLDIYRSNTPGF
jgi:hypothetical protein